MCRSILLRGFFFFAAAWCLPEAEAWAVPTLDVDLSSPFIWPAETPWYEGNYSNEGGVIGPDTRLPFRIFAPRNYDFSGTDAPKHPLIIYLHDAGARDSSTKNYIFFEDSLRYWALPEIQALSPTGGAFVVAPKITNFSDRWTDHPPDPVSGDIFYSSGYSAETTPIADNMELALELVAGLVSGGDNVDFDFTTRVDTSRIYIVGPSMGAFAVWDALGRTPDYSSFLPSEFSSFTFAAGVASSGAGPIDRGATMADTPIWAFHHDEDFVVPSAGTANMIAAIEAAGGEPFFETDAIIDGEPFSTDLATILGKKHLLTRYQGPAPPGSTNTHGWAASTAHDLNGQNDYVARWLFSQQTVVPEPTSAALLLLGIVAIAFRRRDIRR